MTRQVLAYGIHHIRKSFVPIVLERATNGVGKSLTVCLLENAIFIAEASEYKFL